MTAEKDAAGCHEFDGRDCILQSRAIAFGFTGSGRTVGSVLTVRQIATQYDESYFGKSFCQRNQKRSLAVRPSAVGDDKAIAVGISGAV